MSHKIVLLILLFIISIVFYFSWLPDPSLKSETYLPNWLLKWSNQYYNLRTAIPFVAVGFLLEAYAHYKSLQEFNPKKINFLQNMGIAALIVCIAEGGQFLIHKRSPDIMDVFYGIIGSIIGAIGYNLLKKNKKCETDINLPS